MKLSSKARYGLKACLALAENYNENQPLALPFNAQLSDSLPPDVK